MGKGGAERVISLISNHQALLGNEVVICTLLDSKIEYYLNENIRVIHLTRGEHRFLNILFWINNIRKIIRSQKPDYVISFIARINILVLIGALFLRTKVIISERNNPKKDGRKLLIKVATLLLYPLSNKIVFQTNDVKEMFSKRIRNKSIVIPNPIMSGLPTRNNVEEQIVSVGRLEKQKNHKILIDAFHIISKEFPLLSLHIYGSGSEFQNLSNQILSLNLNETVILHGKKDDVHNLIKNAKLFVLPSLYEGLSNALMEAMSMGIPVIGSDIIGINNLIINQYNGVIFVNNDTIDLARKITYALNNYDILLSMTDRAKNDMGKYSEVKIMQVWEEILRGEKV